MGGGEERGTSPPGREAWPPPPCRRRPPGRPPCGPSLRAPRRVVVSQGVVRRAPHNAHAARLLHRLPYLHLPAAHGQHAPAGRGLVCADFIAAFLIILGGGRCSLGPGGVQGWVSGRGGSRAALVPVGAVLPPTKQSSPQPPPPVQVRGHHAEAAVDWLPAHAGRLPRRLAAVACAAASPPLAHAAGGGRHAGRGSSAAPQMVGWAAWIPACFPSTLFQLYTVVTVDYRQSTECKGLAAARPGLNQPQAPQLAGELIH